MITPQHLINAIGNEIRILKHLGSKVTPENKDFKLTPAQRSTEELEQYIVSSFPAQIKCFVLGSRDTDVYMRLSSQFDGFTFDQFDTALDAGFALIQNEILSLNADARQQEISIRGMTGPRVKFLNDYVLTFLGAYKMQLFLQLKASGCAELGTSNLRAGMDAPKS